MVKAGKLRSGTAQKLKRWKKGHSSESNPETSRYRQAARSRFFSRPSVRSDLTVDALKLHNDLQSGPLEHKETKDDTAFEVDEPALTERTSATFLSGLSDCSNLTFNKVQRFWESNSAAHMEICAVLAAVTEVIRSQGGKETETEYFAALMTTLEAVESSESVGAVAYLLNLVLKRVPSPVLSLKFSDTSKVFMNIMSSQASSESPSALRWILSCLANLLRKQDASVWSYPSTLQVYHGLLSFTVHSKPKVRKAAQHGVCSILRGSDFMFGDSAPSHHPAAQSTARFCIKEMEQAGGNKEDTTVLHILGLLKELLPCFPHGAVKSCCETLLRVMTLSHVLVTAGAMQAFHKLFSAKPNSSSLPAELNAQIITALYDYLPSENDLQPLLAWLAVMEKAHTHLSSLQISLCLGHLPRLFTAAMTCFLSPHVQVVSTAAQTLKTLLKECVAPCMAEIGSITSTAPCGNASYICKMFRLVEEGLTYRYYSSWPFVMQVLSCFYQVAGKEAHPIMVKSLQSLCDLRLTPRFPFSGELDQTVGSAVESMGPEIVLRAIPLQIDGNEDDLEFPRSWLIPVIRDRVKNTELGFFTTYLLPLATTLKNKADELSQAGRNLESKVYMTLHLQIWSMLPGFCMQPTDLATSFKGIARALGMVIGDRSDLRLTVCHAIRTLINKSIRKAEDRAEVARFAKNFLPILFNVYTQQPAAVDSAALRMPVLDTIKMYLTITDQEPTDLATSFKGIARVLGMVISDRPDLRLTVCHAIRTLINKSIRKEEDHAEVARFAKNFLPILFNVYTQQPSAVDSAALRMPVLDTIKVYLTITDQEMVCTFLQKATEKLCSQESSGFTRFHQTEDRAEVARFAKNFLPILFNVYTQQPAAVDSAALRMPVLDTIKVYLTITDQEMVCTFLQKATEKLCSQESSGFTRLAVMDLIMAMAPCVDESTMTTTFELVKPYLASKESGLQKKAYRILEEMCGGEREPCRQFVLTNLEELKRTLLGSLKSASSPAKRVMICTNEVAVGARRNAYTLLVEIGRAFIRFCGSQKEAILQYLELIYAGFTGSVTMISCTVLALTRLVYEFKDSLERSVIEPLLRNVCLLLSSRTREVVKTALSFVKVILFIMDVKVLATHMPLLMEGIGNIKEDMRRHFRTKLKNIFTKFIRKFGFELVKNMLPEEYHKVLVNIRKVEARNKQRKTLKHDADSESENEEDTSKPKGDSIEDILADSEDEDEEEKKGRGGKKQPAQKGKAWLKEGEGDEPLNFLDPMVSQRVLGVKEEMEDILEEAGVKSKNQKRKFKEGNLDEDMEMEPQFQYKAGGSGIHRPLSRKGDCGGQYKAKAWSELSTISLEKNRLQNPISVLALDKTCFRF
ncbi:UNVERIFIED_CONTAM: hypothetical protein FKN15_021253 [Acipenser sinensis]